MRRWSVVRDMKVNSVVLSSILQVGDNEIIKPTSKALAVQRELPEFDENEGNFKEFPLFSREIPLPPIDNEAVDVSIDNTSSRIQVGCLNIYGVSSSSVLQVGANKKIQAEARIKHIRQFSGS